MATEKHRRRVILTEDTHKFPLTLVERDARQAQQASTIILLVLVLFTLAMLAYFYFQAVPR